MFLKQVVYKKGQSLVEVVIALAIAILIITALISATTTAMKNAQFGKNHELALKLAQEGMEWVRSQRDQITWNEFKSKDGSTLWCLPSDLTSLAWDNLPTGNCSKISSIFTRTLNIVKENGTCLTPTSSPTNSSVKVIINVNWTDAAGSHKSEQTSCFTNWQKK